MGYVGGQSGNILAISSLVSFRLIKKEFRIFFLSFGKSMGSIVRVPLHIRGKSAEPDDFGGISYLMCTGGVPSLSTTNVGGKKDLYVGF